jgi:hypothetical protein
MSRACSTNGEKGNSYIILVGKPEGKRPLGRPRRRWVDNIKMDFREVGWDSVDVIGVSQEKDHDNQSSGSIKCWEFLEWLHKWQLLKKGSAPWMSDNIIKYKFHRYHRYQRFGRTCCLFLKCNKNKKIMDFRNVKLPPYSVSLLHWDQLSPSGTLK